MRVAMGITPATAGTVQWKGCPIGPDERLRFGYMPEERGLYPGMVVSEQLVYLARLHGVDASTASRETDRWLHRLGITDRAGDKTDTLSLGNQQRVQLAAALVHGPEMLVLDEPFSGLDPVGVDTLGAALAERAEQGVAVLFSSHQLDLVEHLCQDVVIVNDGKVVADGEVVDLTTVDRRLAVEVEGDPGAAWADGIAGVEVVTVEQGRARLALDRDVDPQAVLDTARRAGPVAHFSHDRLLLSEVFREAVARAAP